MNKAKGVNDEKEEKRKSERMSSFLTSFHSLQATLNLNIDDLDDRSQSKSSLGPF